MKRIPDATYRLQFNAQFTFRHATEIIAYLAELGISDCYTSPLFRAGPESRHGYDVCSFAELGSQLGGREGFDEFSRVLQNHGLGLLLDIVPNHMSIDASNAWWSDVLKRGRASPYAPFFDINWFAPHPALNGCILLPVLEDQYGDVLESGKLRLVRSRDKIEVKYHDRVFPIDPDSVPAEATTQPEAFLESINGRPGESHSFDKLDALLRRQHYRLAFWKLGSEEINYRRFFNVVDLVSLKVELPEVFDATHQMLLSLVKEGKVSGLRVDHPDGLWDPRSYFYRLRASGCANQAYVVVEKILSPGESLPGEWPVDGTTGYDFLNRVNGLFVDGDKAGEFDRIYREFSGRSVNFSEVCWQSKRAVLQRTFRGEVNALTRRLHEIAATCRHGRDFTFSQLRSGLVDFIAGFPVYRTYMSQSDTGLSPGDAEAVRSALAKARENSDGTREVFDFIKSLLLLEVENEVGVDLPGVREFVMKFQQLTGPAAAKGIEDTAFYNFNRLISLNEVGGNPEKFGVALDEFHEGILAIATQWPHTLLATATHDTKRGEDVRARINVLSEMPDEWRDCLARWYQVNADKKEIVDGQLTPDPNDEYLLYQTLLGAWSADADSPEGLKAFRERVAAYMIKAVKEAKAHTRWTVPNKPYEDAIQSFTERILSGDSRNVFLDDLRKFERRIAYFGQFNSLSQTLLKMTSPGVPDFYQGSELWDLNLVDPDNRRPVDFPLRRKLLENLKNETESQGRDASDFDWDFRRFDQIGIAKLFLIWRALNFRRSNAELFASGDYVPLPASGKKHNHVCAFMRNGGGRTVIIIVPRLVLGLTEGREIPPLGNEIWNGTILPLRQSRPGQVFLNVLTNQEVTVVKQGGSSALMLEDILRSFPVALLEQQ